MARSTPREADTTLPARTTGAGDAPGVQRWLLVVGEGAFRNVPLPARGELVIGRESDCDLALANAQISRRHVKLVIDREVAVVDLGSTNGIKIGGQRLARGVPAILPIGESLRLGPFTAIVLLRPAGQDTDPERARASLQIDDPTPEGKTELLERIARADVNVLVHAETGAGKEILASTLHALSGRPGSLVAINCAALSGALLESELFGHERGAFTGAVKTKPGLLEIAGKGTALLDEIGDLPLELQGKLLRALETRQVYRVGGVQPIEVQARIIAASHRDLPADVTAGKFRQDLYFRINGITLTIPPLRDRHAVIARLAEKFAVAGGGKGITHAAHGALAAYDWPGNVRELRQVIERALLLADGGRIDAAHILLSPARTAAAPELSPEELERARFITLAREQRGNASAIARELKTSRSQVRRLAERHGVDLDALR